MIKILAIDDISDNLLSLKAILKDLFADAMVLTAQSGPIGIELAISENPDVILLDIVMPGMDGFQVCQELKKSELVRNIPVVFLTALKGDKENRIKALEYGAEGFLSKPIDETELTAQIRAMVKIKKANTEKQEENLNLNRLVIERTKALETELAERRQTEKLLQESEFFFRESQSAAFIGSYQFDLVKNQWSSSEILDQIFGIDTKYNRNLEGWSDLIHPEDQMMMDEYFAHEVVEKKIPFRKEYRIIHQSSGETRWVLGLGKLTYDELGNVTQMIGTIQDITWRKQQEEKLQETHELNRSLLQTVPYGMEIVDEEGNVLFMNESMERMVGLERSGKKCWELNRDDKIQCRDCPLVTGFEIGKTKYYETSGVLGGKTFLISHTGMVYKGRKAMLEIFQDVTEKKVVEQKVKLLAHSLESINECVSVTDNDDMIIYINKSFTHTYGYTKEELIGQHTSLLRPPEIANAHIREILPITIEGGWRGEIMNRKKDGTLFPISLSTSVIKDDHDEPIALIGVATDITEMRKSREELISAKEKAEESNRLKTAFLNNMSHEIRTPMNHIMGFSSLMAEAECKEKDDFAAIVLSSSNQLLSLIEKVILLSRLQSERAEINNHPFVLYDMVTHVAESFQPECLRKHIVILANIPPELKQLTISSDSEKIRQILENLLSNAVKYTQHGTIEIGFNIVEKIHEFSQRKQQQIIKFHVRDTGFGIPLHEQSKIFDSFYRTDQAMSNAIGGTGLGLSIVKELVKSLNGNISVNSTPGEGSNFSFTIPLITAESIIQLENSILTPRRTLKEMVLLIADDEPINFLYLEVMLKNLVSRIDHAYNGRQAVEMAEREHYDLVFMDLKMPEMNGYDATRIIKQQHPEITIIAQTAYASPEDEEKAIQAGCDDFIAKPLKKSLLLETLLKYS